MNQLDKWLRKLEEHEKEENPPEEVANMPAGDYEALLEEIDHRSGLERLPFPDYLS